MMSGAAVRSFPAARFSKTSVKNVTPADEFLTDKNLDLLDL